MTSTAWPETDQNWLAQQRAAIIKCFDTYIPAEKPVAIVPFPFDGNVGNHMMWIGIVEYLRTRGIPLVYTAHPWSLDLNDLKRAIGDGTVIFLGGVSVSRLWPWDAEVKRPVAAACPENRLVSLPSTMILIDEEDRVVTISHGGYAKTQPLEDYQAQRRGGKGKSATAVKDEDFVEHLLNVCCVTIW